MDVEERFRQLYEETYGTIAPMVIARCRQTADAGDILQDVYLELYRILQRRGVDYVKAPEALLKRLVRQKLFRYYRILAGRKEVYTEPMEDGSEVDMADIHALSVEEMTVDREVLEWTERYLSQKGETVRKIFHLYYRFGMTASEIAAMLGRTEADVKNKLYRTLQEIRKHWKGVES